MLDLGISKIALMGVVALIVIGPEKLPRVARTLGTMLGKAQRYVADVKAEVNRSMDLDELKKMKETMEDAARGVEQSRGLRVGQSQVGHAGAIVGGGESRSTRNRCAHEVDRRQILRLRSALR